MKKYCPICKRFYEDDSPTGTGYCPYIYNHVVLKKKAEAEEAARKRGASSSHRSSSSGGGGSVFRDIDSGMVLGAIFGLCMPLISLLICLIFRNNHPSLFKGCLFATIAYGAIAVLSGIVALILFLTGVINGNPPTP